MATTSKANPIPGERIILTSDNGVLTLTNYRVKHDAKISGKSKFLSITLESVSSCGLVTRTNPALLIIAAILGALGVFGFIGQGNQYAPGMLLLGLCFGVAYQLTKSGGITISSNGGEEIFVSTKSMSHESTLVFIEAVTEAKLKCIGKLIVQ